MFFAQRRIGERISLNGGKPPKKKNPPKESNVNNNITNNINNNNDKNTNGVVEPEPKVQEITIKQEDPPAPPPSVKINHVDKTVSSPIIYYSIGITILPD
ncbi:unnamed protein product [Nesidiocoris tenuis]|uniref:Uncharacterized protein n=1 Tax=Nesidiocoris tenuis TaxID=355587 RepID=A0A6H5GLL7_9HEMI|nr:unnamed protein product [Nesidiocoris tenuis]